MKRFMARVSVLLLAGLLVSCGGGGGGSSSGGGPGNASGGGGTFPSAGAHVEESDPAVTLSAGWTPSDPEAGWSGGAAVQSTASGATASFTFTGTSVRWIGSRGRGHGVAEVRVDGGPPIRVDLHALPSDEIRTPVLTINDLSDGKHTLTIEVKGERDPSSNVVVVDAFEVQAPIVSRLQETDPDVTFGPGWALNTSFPWSGGGVANNNETAPGAQVTETAGSTVTLNFRGTSISWIGFRGPDAGIALVRVDGGAPTIVDTYSPAIKFQEVVFTATGLADANHTLTIEATGGKNGASRTAKIFVDAFEVTTPGRRYQEDDLKKIVYSGRWIDRNDNRTWSEGAVATTSEANASATFSFTGTSVSWIGCRKNTQGRARIFLDGVPTNPQVVNNFMLFPIEGYQDTIFRVDGLTNGPHTLQIVAEGGGFTVIDAFDVRP